MDRPHYSGIKLTITEVYDTLQEIANASGEGSRKHKEQLLERMFAQTEPDESEILARIIFGEMRIGVNEGMMLEGIAESTEHGPSARSQSADDDRRHRQGSRGSSSTG